MRWRKPSWSFPVAVCGHSTKRLLDERAKHLELQTGVSDRSDAMSAGRPLSAESLFDGHLRTLRGLARQMLDPRVQHGAKRLEKLDA